MTPPQTGRPSAIAAHRPGPWSRLARRARFSLLPSKSIEYIGCRAFNLGDQAIYLATARLFTDSTVCFAGSRMNWGRRSGSMLGGGTLIGAGEWSRQLLEEFEGSLARTGRGFAFGTGVAELAFPADRHAFEADPSTYTGWGRALKDCQYVGVRGPRSQAALAEMGVHSEVIGDPAAALVRPGSFWQPDAGCLGISVGNGGGPLWGDREVFEGKMAAFLSQAVAQGWRPRFYALMEDDLPVIAGIARLAGIHEPQVLRCYADPQAFLQSVAGCQAFIGFKLHSVILAMCAQVPSIMIEYRPKGLDFMESMQLGQYCVRTDEVEPERLMADLATIVGQGPQLSRCIRERLEAFSHLQAARARDLARGSVGQ